MRLSAFVTQICGTCQNKYGQLIPHKILEPGDVAKMIVYHPADPIASVFEIAEEILEWSDLVDTPIYQYQATNIDYVILHNTGQFTLDIFEWNQKTPNFKTWINLKKNFCTDQQKI